MCFAGMQYLDNKQILEIIILYYKKLVNKLHIRTRVANRPGMAGTVPELTSGVPCPGLGHFCPGIY